MDTSSRVARITLLLSAKVVGLDDCVPEHDFGKGRVASVSSKSAYGKDKAVTHTLIVGRVVYDRSEYLNLPSARRAQPVVGGGGGVGCCLGMW
jgi:hypothetical protein